MPRTIHPTYPPSEKVSLDIKEREVSFSSFLQFLCWVMHAIIGYKSNAIVLNIAFDEVFLYL